MRPTEILMHEHEIVLRALSVLDAMRARTISGAALPVDDVAKLTDFFRQFLDGCHHAKEERVLFPALEEAGVPNEGGPVGVMLYEHEVGRTLVRELARADERFVTAAEEFSNLLRGHIDKENQILFRIADRVLTPRQQNDVVRAFDTHEEATIGVGGHDRFVKQLDQLAADWLPASRSPTV